jgi:hypothetical protein
VHHALDCPRPGSKEEPLEDGEIQPFMLQGKSEVAFEAGLRLMTGRQNALAALIDDPVTLTYCGQREGEWHGKGVGIDQSGVSRRLGLLGKPPFTKNRNRS